MDKMDKKQLRKFVKILRRTLDTEELSKKIVSNIRLIPEYANGKNIMIYLPLEDEIDITDLLNDEGKDFYLPKIDGDNLLVCPYKKGDKTTLSEFKTKEPVTEPVSVDILDVVFVPAICADSYLNRIGYGKGYYDRFLKTVKNAYKVVPLAKSCFVRRFPASETDEPVDLIIMETGAIC